MRIGLYTLPFDGNFGGILQACCLSHVLESCGHDVVVFEKRRNAGRVKNLLKRVKWGAIPLLYRIGVFRRHPLVATVGFVERNIRQTPLMFTSQELDRYSRSNNIDAVVVGSDQVWRASSAPGIRSSFVDFGDERMLRLAYAVSFGINRWGLSREETEDCRRLVKRFRWVSARENVGVTLCQEHLGVEADLVIDPTLLAGVDFLKSFVTRMNWSGLCSYILDDDDKKRRLIKMITQSSELEVRSIWDRQVEPSVENWLSLFSNAKCVVTDSYHGTCMSILFHKPFVSLCNSERGNTRFESLLNQLGLGDRLISDYDRALDVLSLNIDWVTVDRRLIRMRDWSFGLLCTNLEEC